VQKKIMVLGILFLLGGQVVYGNDKDENNKHLKEKNASNQQYFFEKSNVEIEKFIIKVNNLKNGMDIQEVIEHLGEPYSNNARKSKKWNESSKGRCLTYYLKMWRKNSVNELKDSYVLIYFDENNKMEDVIIKLK